jgi:hypothetical protein
LETVLELEGIKGGKDPIKGVVGGDAMGQIEEGRVPRAKRLGVESALVSPKSSMSSQLSAPPITAQMAIAMILRRGWSFVRSTRGSSREAK